MNRKVKQRISAHDASEAIDDEDIAVQYIINYHGLIE